MLLLGPDLLPETPRPAKMIKRSHAFEPSFGRDRFQECLFCGMSAGPMLLGMLLRRMVFGLISKDTSKPTWLFGSVAGGFDLLVGLSAETTQLFQTASLNQQVWVKIKLDWGIV